ncbi:hypothetical protein [Micrococcus terreus]|nr:hypothetical protein [Micrococcus terreus]
MLAKLHPGARGNPGNAGALAPAIVLTAVSASEGFVEEFVALVAAHRIQSFRQIAKLVSMNNPTVRVFDEKLRQVLAWGDGTILKTPFAVNVWKPTAIGDSSWVRKQALSWTDAETHAEGWMQVRHCLTHGLARGFRSEVWPGPLRGTVSASSVLRPRSNGKYSLSVHGAESYAHIYCVCAQRLADEAAFFVGNPTLDWSRVPDFKL